MMEASDGLQHEDKCRFWDDGEFCDCGTKEVDRLEKVISELTTERDGWKATAESWKDMGLAETMRDIAGKVELLKAERDAANSTLSIIRSAVGSEDVVGAVDKLKEFAQWCVDNWQCDRPHEAYTDAFCGSPSCRRCSANRVLTAPTSKGFTGGAE
jgi:hypothetical protein